MNTCINQGNFFSQFVHVNEFEKEFQIHAHVSYLDFQTLENYEKKLTTIMV